MKQNHRNYRFIIQMMTQRKETFNTTIIQYSPNWIKSKFMAE